MNRDEFAARAAANFPTHQFPAEFRPALVSDQFFPVVIRITFYAIDQLLLAVNKLANSEASEQMSRSTWLDLWALNESLFTFIYRFGAAVHALYGFPPVGTPWWYFTARIGRHYQSIPLSRASLLLPSRSADRPPVVHLDF